MENRRIARAAAFTLVAVLLVPMALAVPCPLFEPLSEKWDFGPSLLKGVLCDEWRLLSRVGELTPEG